jgi:tetratricopeptide (TPR) repeat protein
MSATGARSALTAALVLVAARLAAVEARTQQPTPPPPAGRVAHAALEKFTDEWRAAALAHVGATFDEPAASIARWEDELTRQVVDHAVEQFQGARKGGAADRAVVIAKGLLLHTDIGIAERTDKATPAGTVEPVLLDAMPIASRRFSLHWRHARVLADALATIPPGKRNAQGRPTLAVARAWYRAVGALFQYWADLGHLDAHLGDGDGLLGEDPVLLLYQGALHQAYADPRLQTYLRERRTSTRGGPDGPMATDTTVFGAVHLPFENASIELTRAERALRRALALDGSLVEARIRLAHVLDACGKPAEAAAQARQALAAPLPPFLEYYAAMVLGRAEAALGHYADAHTSFSRALARYPRSQATHVALSQIAISGSVGMAAETLLPALGPDPADVEDDPWAWYWRLHEPDAPSLYEALKTSVP